MGGGRRRAGAKGVAQTGSVPSAGPALPGWGRYLHAWDGQAQQALKQASMLVASSRQGGLLSSQQAGTASRAAAGWDDQPAASNVRLASNGLLVAMGGALRPNGASALCNNAHETTLTAACASRRRRQAQPSGGVGEQASVGGGDTWVGWPHASCLPTGARSTYTGSDDTPQSFPLRVTRK